MELINHEVKQGSENWLNLRKNYFGASEASAMLGISPYKTRDELLYEKATGISKEVDSFTQKIFDTGHKAEDLTRPLVEQYLGEELYPLVRSMGKILCSTDGLTIAENIAWENKQYNTKLVESLEAGILPEHHQPQVQQTLLLTKAEKLLFTCSHQEFDDNGELAVKKFSSLWVYPDAEYQQKIIDGWAQFEKDLVNYVVVEKIEKPKAQVVKSLPALLIKIDSKIVSSNLAVFKSEAMDFIATIKTELVTDQDFADGELMAKNLKDAEDAIEYAKKAALADSASVEELMRTLDLVKEELRQARLKITKAVDTEKERIKLEMIKKYATLFVTHKADVLSDLNLKTYQTSSPDFSQAIKGKKTIKSMESACNDMLAQAKIEIDATARDLRSKINWYNENAKDYQALFADFETIIYKSKDDFELLVNSRIDNAKRQEAEREERIRLEAEKKAQEAIKIEPVITTSSDGEITIRPISNDGDVLSISQSTIIGNQSTIKPTTLDIINLVQKAYNVNQSIAIQWLKSLDFTNADPF